MSAVVEFRKPIPGRDGPTDLSVEHAILGILLRQNSALSDMPEGFIPDVFSEGLHARIFLALSDIINKGATADPITVNHRLMSDDSLIALGGQRFLLDIYDKSPPATQINNLSEILSELWRRRELILIATRIDNSARDGENSKLTIEDIEHACLALQLNSSSLRLVDAATALDSVILQLDNPHLAFGTKTGLSPIDDVTGGFMPGELWLLAGRPGAGKSAIASTAALSISQTVNYGGEPMGAIEICSEMTVQQMMRRHIADTAYELFGRDAPTYSNIRKRQISVEQRKMFNAANRRLREFGTLKSLYRTGLTVNFLRSIIRRQMSAWSRTGIKLGIVTVDHVGLLKSSSNTRGRTESQGEVAREMKELAGELNIPILALVQLNRKVEERDDKRPMLSDLRDSGEWEENADGVIGCYREAYYAQREPEPKRHDLKILWDERRTSPFVDAIFMKIREGEMQTVRLWADMGRNAIRGQAPESAYHAPLLDVLDADQTLPAYGASDFE